MPSRVTVTVDVRDTSRRGIRQVRNEIRRLRNDVQHAGGQVDFNLRVPPGDAARVRRQVNRLQHQLSGQNVRFNTTIRQPTRAERHRFTNTLTRQFRGVGGTVGGVLSDGIGQGIIGGIRAGGPVFATAFIAFLAGLASVIGAALSGLLVTALGAGFVAIGGFSAAKSKEVKDQWSSTLKVLKREFKDVGEPMIPVLVRGLKLLEDMATKAAPKLKRALLDATGATNEFVDGLAKGFESFGKAAFKPIMDAWNVFAPVFGEEWDEFMDELGKSFADMANLVKEHPTEIAAALDVVFEALDLLVDTVTFFGKVWVFTMQNVGLAVGGVIRVFALLVQGVTFALQAILDQAVAAFGWIPGIGPKLKNASKNFAQFRSDTVSKLNDMAVKAGFWGVQLDIANKKRQLKADISVWQSRLSKARADLKKTTSQKAQAKLRADISDLTNKIRNARNQLNNLNGKTAVTRIITYSDTYRSLHDIVGKATGGVIGAGKATGGVIGTAATGGVRSNMTLVGEHGPELAELPTGSRVRSNSDSRRLAAFNDARRGSAGTLEIVSDDVAMLQLFRRVVRKAGGDFDLVFKKGRAAR